MANTATNTATNTAIKRHPLSLGLLFIYTPEQIGFKLSSFKRVVHLKVCVYARLWEWRPMMKIARFQPFLTILMETKVTRKI